MPEGKDWEAVGAVIVAVGGVVSDGGDGGGGAGGGGVGGGGLGGGGLGGGGVGVTEDTVTVKLCEVAPPSPEQRIE